MPLFLVRLAKGWATIEVILLAFVLLALVLLSVVQILLRNVFGTSLFWIDPLNRLLVLWLALLGAMVATREKQHIAVDVLKHYLTGLPLVVITKCAEVFAGVVCALMAYHSGRFVYDEFLFDNRTFSDLPAWPFELIMPLGFGVMAIRFFYSVVFTRISESTH